MTIDRIPASGESALAGLERVRTVDVPITRNVAKVTAKYLRVHEAFVLTLSATP